LGYGLFSGLSGDGTCVKYSANYDPDGAHQAGRAFGVVANLCLVFAFIGISLVIFILKDKPARIVWLITRILYVCALFSVIFTFSFLGVAFEEPSLGPAGSINAVNAIFLISIVATCWCTPIPPEPVFKNIGQGGAKTGAPAASSAASANPGGAKQVTKTIEVTPNGRKITEEVIHADGTKEIIETFEEAEGTQHDDEESQSRGGTASANLSAFEEEDSAYAPEEDTSSQRYMPPRASEQGSNNRGRGAEPAGTSVIRAP